MKRAPSARVHHRLIMVLALPLLLLSATVRGESIDGKQLHDSACVACHASRFGNNGSDIYTRADRRVNSLQTLNTQVRRCRANLKLPWFDDELNAVTDYLNRTYYHFDK